MHYIRQLYDDLPDFIPIPNELKHSKAEVIILPLAKNAQNQTATQALKSFLITKDTNALTDLNTDEFSQNRKMILGGKLNCETALLTSRPDRF